MFSLICAGLNGWVNNGEAGGLRHHRAHYDVTVMMLCWPFFSVTWIIYTSNRPFDDIQLSVYLGCICHIFELVIQIPSKNLLLWFRSWSSNHYLFSQGTTGVSNFVTNILLGFDERKNELFHEMSFLIENNYPYGPMIYLTALAREFTRWVWTESVCNRGHPTDRHPGMVDCYEFLYEWVSNEPIWQIRLSKSGIIWHLQMMKGNCAGNSPVTGEFPHKGQWRGAFDVFFDLRLNKPLSKHRLMIYVLTVVISINKRAKNVFIQASLPHVLFALHALHTRLEKHFIVKNLRPRSQCG